MQSLPLKSTLNWFFSRPRPPFIAVTATATALVTTLVTTVPTALAATPAQAPTFDPWPDDDATRLKALALLQSLNATLLSQPSATRTLTQWGAAHQIAPQPEIKALQGEKKPKEAPESVRTALAIEPGQSIAYRRVQLQCGDQVLSEADNWYVPARLTDAMNTVLETTQTPFGTAVRDLHFSRKTVSARLLWEPLPAHWEMQSMREVENTQEMPNKQTMQTMQDRPALQIPAYVLQHAAILSRADGVPFSYVQETYTRNIFAFTLKGPTLTAGPSR